MTRLDDQVIPEPQAPHDREHVRMLQNAHADQIESAYGAMRSLPNNPAGVVIQRIGPTRTFIARGKRLENRAIFTGEETDKQIDDVLRHFVEHQSNCVIEVNPANYYVNPPTTWEKRLLKRLLYRGCSIDDFRCVWSRWERPGPDEPAPQHRWEKFESRELNGFIELSRAVEPRKQWTDLDRAEAARPGITHYIGFDERDGPCAISTLFVNGAMGYLAWSFTKAEHRGKGFQSDAIRLRVRDAFGRGCSCVFTVTDFNFASPRNLQQCGFRLAYNYLLLRRDPVPL
jgi:hypothetical protein